MKNITTITTLTTCLFLGIQAFAADTPKPNIVILPNDPRYDCIGRIACCSNNK